MRVEASLSETFLADTFTDEEMQQVVVAVDRAANRTDDLPALWLRTADPGYYWAKVFEASGEQSLARKAMATRVPPKTRNPFRKYGFSRRTVERPGVDPVPFRDWVLGRVIGRLMLRAAARAMARKDHVMFNHYRLAISVGNQADGGTPVATQLSPSELNRAIEEGRLHVVIEPPRG